jgi:uncharacterized spore protein YtfJ
MTTTASEIIGKLMEELRSVAKTETILGKEFVVGDFTLIPVSRISLGFGAGGGQGTENKKAGEGGGGGGGVVVTPIAFVIIKGGEISFQAIRKGGAFDALFEQLPEMVEKILAKGQENKVKSEDEAG